MAKINIFGSRDGFTFAANNANGFTNISGRIGTASSEDLIKRTVRSAGTFSNFYVKITANTLTTVQSTLAFRINKANGNQVIQLPAANSTGEFEDTDSDSVTAGQTVGFHVNTSGTGGTSMTVWAMSILFDASTNTVSHLTLQGTGTLSVASTTTYFPIVGAGGGGTTTETNVQYKAKTAGSALRMLVNVATNTRAQNTTCRMRVNADNGNNLLVTCTGSTTGIFEDAASGQTVAVDDLINYSVTTGTGTGNFAANLISVEFETTNTAWPLINSLGSNTTITAGAGVTYSPVSGGTGAPSATETDVRQDANVAFTWSKLAAYIVSPNGITADTVITSRVNGAPGAQSITFASGVSGYLEDASGTDTIVATDEINYAIAAGGTGTTAAMSMISSLGQVTVAAGRTTKNTRATNLGMELGMNLWGN